MLQQKEKVKYEADMGQIEKSNLSWELLFRNKDIGILKSVEADNAVKEINDKISIEAQYNCFGQESSGIYDGAFYQSLSGICDAIDNVETSRYSDQIYVFHKKPMLESGILGSKAHFQFCSISN
jgi:ubiquitin-activating enzyme E1